MAKLKDTTIMGGLEVSGEVTIPSPVASNNPATKKYVDDIIFNLPTTLTISPSNFESQTAKTFLASPNDEDGVPTFREIIAADIPTLNQDTTGNAETATKLATARTFTITDNDATNSQASATNFDGSNNFTIKLPPTIKASLTGTASGNLTSSSSLDTTKLSGTIPEASLIDASIPVVGIVQTLIKNISGKDLTNYVVDESHMSETYPYALITYQPTPGAITEAQAKTYMKAILGVTWLPQYDYDWPKNIYIIDGSGTLWKPQWINVFGIYELNELRIYYVTKITTDLTLSSGTTNGTLKLVRNGVTTDNIAVKGLGSAAYTESTNYVPTTRKVNNKALSSDITLSLDDVNDGSTRKLSDYVPATRTINNQELSSDVFLNIEDIGYVDGIILLATPTCYPSIDPEDIPLASLYPHMHVFVGEGFWSSELKLYKSVFSISSWSWTEVNITKDKLLTFKYFCNSNSTIYTTFDGFGLIAMNLDTLPDGSTRKLANYLPLTGGELIDNLTIATGKYLIADHISNSGSLEISAQSGVDIIAGQNDGDIRLLGLTEIKPNFAGALPLKVVGYSGLTANIAEFYNNTTLKLSINKDGQLVSPIATGKSPLSVTSTTVNTHFNADKLDGADLETTTLSTTSDVKIPSSKAIATYIANKNYLDSSSTLDDLGDVVITTPVIADLLRYNGTNWANAPASGTYAGPTETYLGGLVNTSPENASSYYLSVADIDNFDEIIIELYIFYTYYWDQSETDTTTDVFVTRTILPHNKFEHYHKQNRDEWNNRGATLTTVNMYSNDIISVHVDRRNASGTELHILFRGIGSGYVAGTPWDTGVNIFGRNW